MTPTSPAGEPGGYAAVTHNGVTYNVHPLNDVRRAALSRWVKKYALDELKTLQALLGKRDYDAARSALLVDFAAKEYEYGTPNYFKLISTPEGELTFLSVILDRDDLEAFELRELNSAIGGEVARLWLLAEGVDPDAKPEETEDPKAKTQRPST